MDWTKKWNIFTVRNPESIDPEEALTVIGSVWGSPGASEIAI
jgi:hypothetical protein